MDEVIATPALAMAKVVAPDTSSDGKPAGRRRVNRSRAAAKNTDNSTNSDIAWKPPRPGRIMINTPTKPTAIAIQRRQPTGSPRNTAAPTATASGNACRIAAIVAKGSACRVVRKASVAQTSMIERYNTVGTSSSRSLRSKPCCQMITNTNSNSIEPRMAMIWPTCNSPSRDLINMSLMVNPIIDNIIYRLARTLADKGVLEVVITYSNFYSPCSDRLPLYVGKRRSLFPYSNITGE